MFELFAAKQSAGLVHRPPLIPWWVPRINLVSRGRPHWGREHFLGMVRSGWESVVLHADLVLPSLALEPVKAGLARTHVRGSQVLICPNDL